MPLSAGTAASGWPTPTDPTNWFRRRNRSWGAELERPHGVALSRMLSKHLSIIDNLSLPVHQGWGTSGALGRPLWQFVPHREIHEVLEKRLNNMKTNPVTATNFSKENNKEVVGGKLSSSGPGHTAYGFTDKLHGDCQGKKIRCCMSHLEEKWTKGLWLTVTKRDQFRASLQINTWSRTGRVVRTNVLSWSCSSLAEFVSRSLTETIMATGFAVSEQKTPRRMW